MPPTDVGDPKAHPYYGKTLAKCVVGEALGRGRTSWVCRAQHQKLEREVALKILTGEMAELSEIRGRFIDEARALAQIDHPHIVKVTDVVEDQGHLCILMDYVAGETLQDRLKASGKLPVRKALRIAHQTAQALAAAHAEKVVHRDVKPANILLVSGSDEVRMVDFGLAGPKSLANREGTPLYMSPEACQGKRIDEKSDVYALGICLYQMLTGELPFTGKSVRRILAAHVKGEFVPVSKRSPDLGSDYDDLIKKMLVTAKGYRPTAAEAAALLEPLAASDTSREKKKGGGGGRARRGGRPQKKDGPPMGIVIAGVVALILVVFGALFAMKGGDDPEPESGTAPAANGASGGIGPVTPPPPPPKEDLGEKAYNDTEVEALAKHGEWDEVAKLWRAMALAHPGSEWADKARAKATQAEERKQQEAEIAVQKAAREQREAEAVAKRKPMEDALKIYDFAAAARFSDVRGMSNLPGESIQDWRKRKRRIQYLADEFLKQLNEGIQAREYTADYLKEDAGHDEIMVEADAEGVTTKASDLPRRIHWNRVPAEKVWSFMKKKLVRTGTVNGCLFLAILAKETGLEKKSKEYRETALLIGDEQATRALFREYFPDD